MRFFDKRGSGVLLHLTSLPSSFGIGDLGPEAIRFAEFLYRSGQTFWQILPLTPVDRAQSFSPYSSISSMAGNPLLISPELLQKEGLLLSDDLQKHTLPANNNINYSKATKTKSSLLEKAYENFDRQPKEPFDAFCRREAFWLQDFAVFVLLKEHFENKPWYQWPDEFKNRDRKALTKFTTENAALLQKTKWFQYVFFRQWKSLKSYCNELDIKVVGDVPFYVSYDSVDVWSRREIFELDKKGNMVGVAGVPPDYFNDNGQLWGMPVFRWDVLKDKRYDWWVKRIKKNLELVDVLRLDHFRAFDAYWEVPSQEKTAINGKWKKGPGHDFFTVMKEEFGTLPFIAEDLGDITASVYKLRDDFELPGMKVLQFAFGEQMSSSDHIPHNYSENFVVYTGTHDNNTTRGWFEDELAEEFHKQVEDYTGGVTTKNNIHSVMWRLAQASVANISIIPLQDVLGLGSEARMNIPASTENNWAWRLMPGELDQIHEVNLKKSAQLYNR